MPDGCFVVAYAGNLGRAHDVDTIVEAMTLLQEGAKAAPVTISRGKLCSSLSVAELSGANLEREIFSAASQM